MKCDAPWDEDNVDGDDMNFIVLPAGIATPSDGLDYAMLLGSLVVVFFAMGLLGMIRPDSGERRVETRQRIRKRGPSKSKKTRMGPSDDDGDIHLEGADENEQGMTEPLVEVEAEPGGMDVEPEEVSTPLDDFESRLQRLREHRDRLGGN